jgi:hypothetical protein
MPPGIPPAGELAPDGVEEDDEDDGDDDDDDEDEEDDDDDGMDGVGRLGVCGPLDVDEQPDTSAPSRMKPPATEARRCQLMEASLARQSRGKRVK